MRKTKKKFVHTMNIAVEEYNKSKKNKNVMS